MTIVRIDQAYRRDPFGSVRKVALDEMARQLRLCQGPVCGECGTTVTA